MKNIYDNYAKYQLHLYNWKDIKYWFDRTNVIKQKDNTLLVQWGTLN